MHETVVKRIYIGGLSSDVSSEEIYERFSRFGKVNNLKLTKRTDDLSGQIGFGNKFKTFAHLDLEGDETNIKKCFTTYQNAKWKGSVLQLQYAKESFLQKLEKERLEAQNQKEVAPETKPSPSSQKPQPEQFVVKGPAVPGTPVPGKTDWIVGKYGRVLPILKLKKSYKIKMVKYDPSKHCHAAKVFKDDQIKTPSEPSCAKLTWEINTPDNEITKKRKGEFPHVPMSSKKVKGISLLLPESSKKPQQLFPTKKVNEDVEIVKVGSGKNSLNTKINKSNRFDSDVESGSEDGVVGEGVVTDLQIKNRNVLINKTQLISDRSDVKTTSPAFINTDVGKSLLKPTSKNSEVNKSGVTVKNNDIKTQPILARKGHDLAKQQFLLKEREANISGHNTIQSSSSVKTAVAVGKNVLVDHEMKVPEFKGLGMLGLLQQSSEVGQIPSDTGTQSNISLDGTSEPVCTPKVNTTAVMLKKSLAHSKGNMSLLKKGQLLPSAQSDNTSDSPMEESFSKNYDSSSSADTDEIIARCKQSKGLSSKSLMDSTPKSSSTSRNDPLPPRLNSGKNIRNSLVDYSLSLSEFAAEITDQPSQSLSRKGVVKRNDSYDSYDSDLDSNDFELVAKKLAQKAKSTKADVTGKKTLGAKTYGAKTLNVGQDMNNKEHINERIMSLANAGGLTADCTAPGNNKSSLQSKSDHSVSGNKSSLQSKSGHSVPGNKSSLQSKSDHSVSGNKSSLQSKSDHSVSGNKSSLQSKSGHSVPGNSKSSLQSKSDHSVPGNSKSSVQSKSSGQNPIASSKQAADNEKRLQAVRDNMKLKQLQQSISLTALKNIDSKEGTFGKRVVFSSSSSSEDDVSDVDEPTRVKKSRMELFDSNDEEEDYDEIFKSKPHFEGKKGEKLMRLEQRISDPRFKLDAKFALSGSEDEESEQYKKHSSRDIDKSLEEEKSANLKVLENVIGKTTLDRFSEKLKRNTKSIIDMNAVRFDPTKLQNKTESVLAEDKKHSQSRMTVTKDHTIKQTSVMPKTKGDQTDHKVEENSKKQDQKRDKVKDMTESGLEHELAQTLEEKKKIKLKSQKSQIKSAEKSVDKTDSVSNSKMQISSSLVDFFKKKQENSLDIQHTETFSLLKQFDEESVMSEEDEDNKRAPLSALFKKEAEKAEVIGRNKPTPAKSRSEESEDSFSSNVMSEDETSDDEEMKPEESKDQVGEAEQKKKRISLPIDDVDCEEESSEEESLAKDDRSYVADGDAEIDLGLINAGRVDVRFTQEQWLQRWEDIRPALIKMYKRKHKDALRNKRKQNEIKRKKEFLKNSKRNRWARKRVS